MKKTVMRFDVAGRRHVTCNITSCCCRCCCLIAAGTVRRNLPIPSVIAESWRVSLCLSTDRQTIIQNLSTSLSCLYSVHSVRRWRRADSCDIAPSTCAVYAKICAHAQLRIRRLVISTGILAYFSINAASRSLRCG